MTIRTFAITCIAAMTLPAYTLADDQADAAQGDKQKKIKPIVIKTVEIEIKGGLKLKFPENWKRGKPSNSMRLAQFAIPAAKGDKEEGELTLFYGFGGGAKANIERWISQFHATDRESKIEAGAIESGKYFLVEISGTFKKSVGPPRAGQSKPASGYRMLGVILSIEGKRPYFLKLVGPDKTIAAQGTALRAGFGADSKKEKEVKFESLK